MNKSICSNGSALGQTMIAKFNAGKTFFTPERCHIVEMLGGAADAACSIARARVEPGVTTQLHSLRGITERYVILQGEGLMEVGGETGQVKELDVVVIPADEAQRVTNTGVDDLIFLCICSPPFAAEAYVNLEPPGKPDHP